MIGTTLLQFEITAKLGAGGMGEVYRATDTKLGREVAIKVLPEEFTRDKERLARFEREARLLASLNHQTIAAIYQVEESESTHFLVMELVEGEDLAARLCKGAMPVDGALRVALQIAEGLEKAHREGVIHRDLKPSNVMLTPEGQVKILDFGLAKTVQVVGQADYTQALTLTPEMTAQGMILGTAGYMSPEQARGEAVDKQTDIWAFGVIVFELLTGGKAFVRETVAETLAAVLSNEPQWSRLPETVSPSLSRLLRRCLKKDPRDRLQDIGDARIELGEVLGEDEAESMPAQSGPSNRVSKKRAIQYGFLALAAVAIGVVVWSFWPREQLVYLLDTAAPLGVYDVKTRSSGGTNADDLSLVLGSLPIAIAKEAISPMWRREHQVLMQRPALILIHLSAFGYPPGVDDWNQLDSAQSKITEGGLADPIELGRARVVEFIGYVALGSSQTKFIVYSRGHFQVQAESERWISEAVARFPQLDGRLVTYDLPGAWGTESFRDTATGAQVRQLVASILRIE